MVFYSPSVDGVGAAWGDTGHRGTLGGRPRPPKEQAAIPLAGDRPCLKGSPQGPRVRQAAPMREGNKATGLSRPGPCAACSSPPPQRAEGDDGSVTDRHSTLARPGAARAVTPMSALPLSLGPPAIQSERCWPDRWEGAGGEAPAHTPLQRPRAA